MGPIEKGIRIGNFSYYVPHTMKNILHLDAVVFGDGPAPDTDDRWHPEDNLFVPMLDADGMIVGMISVDESKSGMRPTDDTVRPLEIFSSLISQIIVKKKQETRVRQLEEQLYQSQKMESIGRLAGGIAHDFNNILTSIMGWSELLKAKYHTDHEDFLAIDTIYKGTERAAELTRQLLGFARKGKYNIVSTSMNDIVKETVKISEKIFEKSIQVNYDLDPDLGNIDADRNQIVQVLTNLLINAKDAMPKGGELAFRTSNVVISRDQVELFGEFKSGEFIRLDVSDTGIGMSPDIQSQIFEPFFTTKGRGKGTGLGLATVYGIVSNHHGWIDVTSVPGKGTTFSIFLPAAQSHTVRQLKEPEKQSPPDAAGIMIVDDEPEVNALVQRMLTGLGHTVFSARNGREALELFEKHGGNIDLILLDMIMPELAGYEAFYELKKIDPAVKIILVSGYSQDEKSNRLLKDGALGFIQKPFKLGELSRILAKHL